MPDALVEQNFWAKGETKALIRERLTNLGNRTAPVKRAIALPAGQALDIQTAMKSGLMDANTQCYFAESHYPTFKELRRTMFELYPNVKVAMFDGDLLETFEQEGAHVPLFRFITWLVRQGVGPGMIDYCYLDYCGQVGERKLELNRRLSRYLAEDAIISTTLTYGHVRTEPQPDGQQAPFTKLVSERLTQDDIDRTMDAIFALPADDAQNFIKKARKEGWSDLAVNSLALWLKSWGNWPVLEQAYAYIKGSRGFPMVACRARFVRSVI